MTGFNGSGGSLRSLASLESGAHSRRARLIGSPPLIASAYGRQPGSRIVRTGFAEVQRERVRRQSAVLLLRSQCSEASSEKNAVSRIADHANNDTASCSFRGITKQGPKTQHGHRGDAGADHVQRPMSETSRCHSCPGAVAMLRMPTASPQSRLQRLG